MSKTFVVVVLLLVCTAISLAEQQQNPLPNPLFNGNWAGTWKTIAGRNRTGNETTMKISTEEGTGILKIIYWSQGYKEMKVNGKVWENDGNSIRIELPSGSIISLHLKGSDSIWADYTGPREPFSCNYFRQK